MLIKRLEPFKNYFYIMLEQDLTSRNGFRYEGLGRWTMAPDWDPNPRIECDHGLHIVRGHPLYCHNFVNRENPRYFQVKTCPDPPVKSSVGDKFRAKGVFLIREITDFDPEFDSNILADLAKNDSDWDVRQAAVNKLDDSAHSALLADLAKNDSNWYVRWAAKKRILGN